MEKLINFRIIRNRCCSIFMRALWIRLLYGSVMLFTFVFPLSLLNGSSKSNEYSCSCARQYSIAGDLMEINISVVSHVMSVHSLKE